MTVYWILFVVFWGRVAGDCDANTGPPGGLECVSLEDYNNKYQWGTCITDAYMRQKSGAAHQCKDQTRVFCYYQCMLEIHNIEEGLVYNDCSCDPSTPVKSTSIPLPAKCYSPDGTDCSWYRDCLEAKYPCQEFASSYAIDYGEKFCNLYSQHYNKFDNNGRLWIDAVRKCLQVALVPLIRQYKTVSCLEIKQTAFDSHSRCYTSPFPGAPSICFIGARNIFQVFVTIKSAFIDDYKATRDQLLETAEQCGIDYLIQGGKWLIKLIIKKLDNVYDYLYNTVMEKTQNYMKATSSDDGVVVYPMFKDKELNNGTTEETVVFIRFLSRAEYDLNYNGNQDVNVTAVVVKIMNAIEEGDIHFGSQIRSVSQCDDFDCMNSVRTVIPPSSGTSKMQIYFAVLFNEVLWIIWSTLK